MPHEYPGHLISLEGIDKAGKSSVAAAIQDALEQAFAERGIDRDVIINTEPDDGEYGRGNEYGELTRKKLKDDDVHPLALFHSFLSDHYQHIQNVVIPALERGDVVILDRYLESRYAYQPESLAEFFDSKEAAFEWIQTVQEGPSATPLPDMTLYIEITPEESARRGGDADEEVFETSEFQVQVKENYDHLAETFDRFVTIDGMQSPDAVQQEAIDKITAELEAVDGATLPE